MPVCREQLYRGHTDTDTDTETEANQTGLKSTSTCGAEPPSRLNSEEFSFVAKPQTQTKNPQMNKTRTGDLEAGLGSEL
jgi:hypothetical protein